MPANIDAPIQTAQWQTDYRIMDIVERAGSPIETRFRYATEHGHAGVSKIWRVCHYCLSMGRIIFSALTLSSHRWHSPEVRIGKWRN